jgi:hypothetical protein
VGGEEFDLTVYAIVQLKMTDRAAHAGKGIYALLRGGEEPLRRRNLNTLLTPFR